MKQAISYIRFSSARQEGGSSVERQEGMIAKWLLDHQDYELSKLNYSDLGKSGFHGEHVKEGGNFGKLLKAVMDGYIKRDDVVLVEAIDRTGRLPALQMLSDVIAPILRAGVSIITLDDNTTYTEASVGGPHLFMLVAKIQAAHEYSRTLSRRVEDSYKKRRKDAKEKGVAPKRMTPVWLNSDGTVREDVAPWIKTAFELYVSGVGKSTIAKRLRESGVDRLAKTSGPSVEGWLRNKAVIGKWETLIGTPEHHVIDDVYPLIIEPSLFYKAQVHAEKMKTQRPVKTANHFLVGLVRCGACEKNYIVQNLHGKPHSMRCRTRQSQNDCTNSNCVPKPVLDAIYRYTSVTAAVEAVQQQQMGVNEKEIVTREAELLTLAKRVEGLAEAVKQAGPMPELIEALKQSRIAREAAENALVILRSTVVAPAGTGWNEMGKVWKLEADDAQRLAAMLRMVGYHITVQTSGEITSSHSDVLYRYIGVDRALDKYKLLVNGKLALIPKGYVDDYPYHEPFQEVEGEMTWNETDYENLRLQY
ncbi:recombinase family protein [Pseudomonas syringae]|uniref:recombinase family protein n=1 Tax=Pseudomonas syringae TaxID=317 RepID=UPI000FFF02CA|nr:recombinase family protein [Pseudomonas syringae]MCK9776376.1 recombinase family protein [Pseudomonas syringae pv. syringae]RXF65448.1 recombinase [Pseudomonas syringae]